MLGHITSLTKNIVVVGSHGKTTTTSLVASILSSKFRSNNYKRWSFEIFQIILQDLVKVIGAS